MDVTFTIQGSYTFGWDLPCVSIPGDKQDGNLDGHSIGETSLT